jgi:hypothetical protein
MLRDQVSTLQFEHSMAVRRGSLAQPGGAQLRTHGLGASREAPLSRLRPRDCAAHDATRASPRE